MTATDLLLLPLGVATLLWVCWSAGVVVAAALRLEGPAWFRLGLGQAALGTVWTWMILSGVFRPAVVAAVLVVSATAGTWIVLTSNRRNTATALRSVIPTSEISSPEQRSNWLERVLFLLVLATLALIACYPYQGADFLSYQLPMAQGYAESGQWLWFDHLRFPTFPPLMNGWFAVALMLGGRWQIPLAQLSALLPVLVLCALLVRLTRDVEPEARPSWAVALFLGSPAVAWAGMHAYVDGAMSLFMIMAVWCVLRFDQCGGFDGGTPSRGLAPKNQSVAWSWLIAAGVLIGAAMNTKYLGAAFLPLVGAWLLLRWFFNAGAGRSARHLAIMLFTLGGSAFAVCGPWYVTTWIRTGNPVFPFAQSLFGWNPWGWNTSATSRIQHRPAELLQSPLVWDGLSPWLLLTILPATWFWLRRSRRIASGRGLILFVGLGYFLLWLLMPDDRRYLLPALGLLSVTGAQIIGSALRFGPRLLGTHAGRFAVTGVLLALVSAFLADQIRDQGRLPPGPLNQSYVREQLPEIDVLEWAERHLTAERIFAPDTGSLRSFSKKVTLVGDWSGPWAWKRLLWDIETPQDLLQRLQANDIGAVLEARCGKTLVSDKLRIDRWTRDGYSVSAFGLEATTKPFGPAEEHDDSLVSKPAMTRRAAQELFDSALEVVYRDGDMCLRIPRAPGSTSHEAEAR